MPEQTMDYSQLDALLEKSGPAMIVARQELKPAGIDAGAEIVFPPSYANPSKKKDDPPVYNIDDLASSEGRAVARNVCILDSVGSQANRMEPLFASQEYRGLVPQYRVKVGLNEGEIEVSILDAAHRAADALFCGTTLRPKIVKAFKAYARGDAGPMAELAPTSLVFGAWDSRGTQVKIPRAINSIVRAFDVSPLKRSAQYSPPVKYEQEGLLPDGLEGKPSDHGLADAPSVHQIGGILVHGKICRDYSLNVGLIRMMQTGDGEATQKLQRYILSLAMVAFTATQEGTLRQGCTLMPKSAATWRQFFSDGTEQPWNLPTRIGDCAVAAARQFGVTQPHDQPLVFDKSLLKASIDGDQRKKPKKGKAAAAAAGASGMEKGAD